MRIRCLIAGCLVVLILSSVNLAAQSKDTRLADAAAKGDRSAVSALLKQAIEVNSPQADGTTALHWAAFRSDLEMAGLLVRSGANVKAANRNGVTPIYPAAVNGNAAMLELLLKAGADPNAALPAGETPLMTAANAGSVEAVRTLLSHGANVNAKEKVKGETALMWAAAENHIPVVQLLIQNGAEVRACSNVDVVNPARGGIVTSGGGAQAIPCVSGARVDLVAAAAAQNALVPPRGGGPGGARGQAPPRINPAQAGAAFAGQPPLPGAAQAGPPAGPPAPVRPPVPAASVAANAPPSVIDAPVDLDAPPPPPAGGRGGPPRPPGPPLGASGGGGMTPFLFAARAGHLEMVRLLLEAGADINETLADGSSGLVLATLNGHYELAKVLLDRGADPNITDYRGRAALYTALEMRNMRWGEFPKPVGDNLDPLDLIKALLSKGAKPNVQLTYNTEYRGPSNFSQTWESMVGATPFVRAGESGDVVVMKLLVEHGADPKIRTKDNKTALMLASGLGFADGSTFEWSEENTLESVKYCLELGLGVNDKNDKGMTPLHAAAHRGSNLIVKYLLDRGADLNAKDTAGRTPLVWAEGVVTIAQRPARPQPHTVALLRDLMKGAQQ